MTGVKLSEWARINGVSRQSAARWFDAGVLPVPARQLASGTILGGVPDRATAGVVICARVSSCGHRGDLGRQVARLAEHLTANGLAPSKVVSGVGSGLNGHRTRLLGLLRDAWAGMIVAGHRERVSGFGAGYLEAGLAAQGRELIVAGQAGVSDDLVRDMAGMLTSFCARRYGRRSARQRAELALAAASTGQGA